jgi:hypothetical protein
MCYDMFGMKYLPTFLFSIALFAAPLASFAAAGVPDMDISKLSSEKTTLNADGIDNTKITVTLKDSGYAAVVGKKVTLVSSRGVMDEIKVISDTTDGFGQASFRVSSLKNGTSVISARVDNVTLKKTITLTFGNGLTYPIAVGDLVKIPDDGDAKTLNDTAVYYYAVNGRRYVFPNEKVYFTWYNDFSSVKIIPIDQMSLIPIGGNVTYKAASKLVKFQTDVKTYLPTKGGVLRWVKTEEVAQGLFGPQWAQKVDDITEAFYVNYTFGRPIESALDAPLGILSSGSPTISADKGLE